jgi:hypothetical protein
LWEPYRDRPQETAYLSEADVIGYGGSAGGGKTDLLLGLACTKHRRSLILRKEGKQGRGIIDRARDLFGKLGSFNENTGVWRNLPGGRQIEFGGVKDPGDEQNHKGRPKDLLGIDEADQFAESVVRFLMGWVRTTIPGQKCTTVLCFNPPSSAEGRWLITFFGPWIDKRHPRPAQPGELRWYATLKDGKEIERPNGAYFEAQGERIKPRSRTFIPSRVQDNPALMATDYLQTLLSMPEPLRSQLAYGDMEAGLQDDVWQVIPTPWVEASQERWRKTQLVKAGPPDGLELAALGVDCSRGGKDQMVIVKRYGNWFAEPLCYPGKGVPDGERAAILIHRALDSRIATVNVDVVGIGSAVYDACLRVMPFTRINDVNWGETAGTATDKTGSFQFNNLRSMLHWTMREWLDPANGRQLALPPGREVLADLTAPKYTTRGSVIVVESKDEIKKRLRRSPDVGDAILYSMFHGRGPRPYG